MRLIDGDELIKNIENEYEETIKNGGIEQLRTVWKRVIKDAPTIEERPHGTWEQIRRFNKKGRIFLNCNQCNYGKNGEIICELPEIPNFCPNCGARMEG